MHSLTINAKGQITVTYDRTGMDWKLSISDNGVGKSDGVLAYEKSGLGTGIIKALSTQLDAQVETLTGPEGTTVSITHAHVPRKVKGRCLVILIGAPAAIGGTASACNYLSSAA